MFIPAQSDTTYAMLSAADKLLSVKFSFISLKSLHRMASVFPSLLQSLSLITRVAPCNTGGSGNGVLQWDSTLPVSRSVSRAPCFRWEKNIFELNVAWFPCPFFQGYFLSSILKTPLFLQGLALFINHFILCHTAPWVTFSCPFSPTSSPMSECSPFHFSRMNTFNKNS